MTAAPDRPGITRRDDGCRDRPAGSALPPGREPLAAVWRAGVRNPATWVLLLLVRGYQWSVSPLMGPVCRYYPSCSHYGFAAIRRHGPVRGSLLTGWRLLRCNPFTAGGVDHVPAATDRRLPAPPVPHRPTTTQGA